MEIDIRCPECKEEIENEDAIDFCLECKTFHYECPVCGLEISILTSVVEVD